jgi:hypothetical protein
VRRVARCMTSVMLHDRPRVSCLRQVSCCMRCARRYSAVATLPRSMSRTTYHRVRQTWHRRPHEPRRVQHGTSRTACRATRVQHACNARTTLCRDRRSMNSTPQRRRWRRHCGGRASAGAYGGGGKLVLLALLTLVVAHLPREPDGGRKGCRTLEAARVGSPTVRAPGTCYK